MMFRLFLLESKRQWLMFLRYPVEAFAGVIVFTVLFVGLFTGAKYLSGSHTQFGNRLDQVVADYVLWLVTTGLFTEPGSQIADDARSGILEQLFISPHNFTVFTVLRTFSGLVQHLLLVAIIVIVICLITGSRLDYHLVEIFPFVSVIMATVGLGLMVAAYALLVKQVGAILGIGQFILLAAVVTPISTFGNWGTYLSVITPINPGAQLLQRQLSTGYAPTLVDIALAIGNGFLYFILGAYVLSFAAARARRLAVIGTF